MTSIRAFLISVVLSAFTLLNFVAVLKGYDKGLDTAQTILDEQLRDMAKLLAVHSTRISPLGEFDQTAIAYQVIRNGELRERSRNAPEDIVDSQPGFAERNFNRTRWRTYTHYERESDTWVWVAEPEYQRERIAESVVLHTITPILISIPLAGLLIWLIIGVGLHPLKALSVQLQKKQPADLSPLHQDGPLPTELVPVVQAVDELLVRLRQAFEREKHFAADAAHELRTPVSILKVHLHNLEANLSGTSTSENTSKNITSENSTSENSTSENSTAGHNTELQAVRHAADQLARLVEQLLDLYRSSPDTAFQQTETVDLEQAAQDVLAESFELAQAQDQVLELFAEPTLLQGSLFGLKTLLRNLVGNAIKYSPSGGTVRVTVGRRDQHPTLIVEDSGPGIPEQNRHLVLQRFYRQNTDANHHLPGAGLGLAIVSHIAERHQARLELGSSRTLGGLQVTVVFGNRAAATGPSPRPTTDNERSQ